MVYFDRSPSRRRICGCCQGTNRASATQQVIQRTPQNILLYINSDLSSGRKPHYYNIQQQPTQAAAESDHLYVIEKGHYTWEWKYTVSCWTHRHQLMFGKHRLWSKIPFRQDQLCARLAASKPTPAAHNHREPRQKLYPVRPHSFPRQGLRAL